MKNLFLAAYPVSLNGGVITVPVPQTMYQQVVANMQSGETGAIQVVGTPMQLASGEVGGTILAKIEQGEQPREGQAVKATPTSGGLTITPVASTASAEHGTIYQVRTSSYYY